jgi:hypothetical protein
MNTDQEGMDTDGRGCFAMHLNHPCSSVDIRVHHLQTYGLAAGTPVGFVQLDEAVAAA